MRPHIDTQPTDSPDEAFQNDTLRPILKQQHDRLVAVMVHYLDKRKVRLHSLPAAQRFDKVKELVTRDNRLRGLLFGMTVGHFDPEEMQYYLDNESSVNRRITNLLVERLRGAL
ncbi:hypothetical protein CLV84_1410 [Neolewinella xylanilytica]|uniref:Glyoxalase n=1 Tax=Neolewinella xylanilytica TaxID=1514080 RepID=A0A2S6IAB5_9BACT|nr:hypothetical protein [Neolewinella xylanilytica]PPK88443.1 hypothetical protein CLV84_1410 [Neolewinella xylanilytica]